MYCCKQEYRKKHISTIEQNIEQLQTSLAHNNELCDCDDRTKTLYSIISDVSDLMDYHLGSADDNHPLNSCIYDLYQIDDIFEMRCRHNATLTDQDILEINQTITKLISIINEYKNTHYLNPYTFNKLNFAPGIIAYNNFSINPTLPLSHQENSCALSDDLLKVNFPNHYILHAGWYDDRFFTYVQQTTPDDKNNDAVVIKESKDLDGLEQDLKLCVALINTLIIKNNP